MKHILFVCIIAASTWVTEDIKGQWSPVNNPRPSVQILASFGSNLYATSSNVYRSTDDGDSWTTSNGPRGTGVYALAQVDTLLFAGVDAGGVNRSTDHGDTWSTVNNGLKGSKYMYTWWLGVSGKIIFAFSQFGGAVRSLNFGDSWMVSTGLPQ